jgi:small redox-active disulfide protein 2
MLWLNERASTMKMIKVLGSGCRNCEITANVITQAAKDAGVEIELEKVTDIAEIMGYGVMSTPGVVVDGEVVHAGGVPAPDQVRVWVGG